MLFKIIRYLFKYFIMFYNFLVEMMVKICIKYNIVDLCVFM